MHLLTSYRWYFTLMGSMLIFILPSLQRTAEIRYTQIPTIPFDWDSLQAYPVAFQDTSSDEILYQMATTEGIPLFYAQDIVTNVCFDNKCRPLNLTVYWNITGRYLGFQLPDEEFLSRYDHEPFTTEDYIRLNALLADPHLPLEKVAFEELIQTSKVQADSIDAVSGATSKDLLAYVVEGAAYTTYTLWNIIYGPTQTLVRNLTEQKVTPALLTLILKSPSSEDKTWGLGKIEESKELDSRIAEALLEIIEGEDFFVAYSAINLITTAHLRSESLQIGLFSKYEIVNYNLRKQIIERLKKASKLSPEVIKRSRDILDGLNGTQLGYVLELYNQHGIHDITTCRSIARLLKEDNSFIAKKAYQYLVNIQTDDNTIIRALKNYEQIKEK